MSEDASVGLNKRIDSPIGIFGYHIDVKEKDAADWESLNEVQTRPGINLFENINPDLPEASFKGELPYQVYPSTLDGDKNKNFWLPMYFATWNGHSMVLPDKDAFRIYLQTEDIKPDFDPEMNYYLGEAYQYNHKFAQAKVHYEIFKKKKLCLLT